MTSSTTSLDSFLANLASLTFQSRLFTWSAKITPSMDPLRNLTSKGYPFSWLVTGLDTNLLN